MIRFAIVEDNKEANTKLKNCLDIYFNNSNEYQIDSFDSALLFIYKFNLYF